MMTPTGQLEPSSSPPGLSDLPPDVLEHLLGLVSGEEGWAQTIRLTCKWLRDAFDAWNTHMVLGARFFPTNYSVEEGQTREGYLKSFISRTPRLNSVVLKRWSCKADTQLPFPWQQIKHVNIVHPKYGQNGVSWADMSVISQCRVLEHLDFTEGVENLGLPSSLGSCCSTLKRLSVGRPYVDCSSVLALFPTLTALEELELTGYVPGLAPIAKGCPHLRSLKISLLVSYDLQPLASLNQLTSLVLKIIEDQGNVVTDSTWDPLSACSSLRRLSLAYTGGLTTLRALSSLTALTHLDLSYCDALNLGPLSSCIGLQQLNLNRCEGLRDLAPLSSCTALRHLELESCCLNQARVFPALSACSLLEHFDLRYARGIIGDDMPPLSTFQHLRYLNLSGSSNMKDLKHLAALSELRTLHLSGCFSLASLTPLSEMASLRNLSLSHVQRHGGLDLRPLSGLVGLEELNLSESSICHDMTFFSRLTNLQRLNLMGTGFRGKVRDVAPLGHCTSLQYLDLRIAWGYNTDNSLEPLAKCTNLRVLKIDPLDGMGIACERCSESWFEWLDPLSSTHGLEVGVKYDHLEYRTISWDIGLKVWVMRESDDGPLWGDGYDY